jgi:hypothetical protein
LDLAKFAQIAPESVAPVLDPTKESVEWHSHPWKVGTKLWVVDGVTQRTGPGPSLGDVASYIGNVSKGVKVTPYVLTPEGIYRIGPGSNIEWIAPINYLRQ